MLMTETQKYIFQRRLSYELLLVFVCVEIKLAFLNNFITLLRVIYV